MAVHDPDLTAGGPASNPESGHWTIDGALLARPGGDEIMLDLLYGIKENNRQTVAEARRSFKAHQRQVMIATGVNTRFFPGASMKRPARLPGPGDAGLTEADGAGNLSPLRQPELTVWRGQHHREASIGSYPIEGAIRHACNSKTS